MALGPLQAFVDSDAGGVFLSFLHTAGAILYLGGILAYGIWLSNARAGSDDRRVRVGATVAVYLAILMNLLGGIGRTYQTGHPGLADVAHSPWVQIMLVKHIVLLFGMFVAVWLLERLAPRMLRHIKGRGDGAIKQTHRTALWLVVVTIFVSAALGAASTTATLDTRQSNDDDDAAGRGDDAQPGATLAPGDRHYAFSGSLTTHPAAPRSATGTFDVLTGTSELAARLASESPTPLTLTLIDPSGNATTGNEQSVPAPLAGTWTFEVAAEAAFDAVWEVTVDLGGPRENLLSGSVTLAPNLFFEVNTDMVTDQTIHWTWRTQDGSDVDFNLHTHDDAGNVEYPVELTASRHAGNHTATYDAGYSLMWTNPNPVPVTVSWTAWGEYTFHSYTP